VIRKSKSLAQGPVPDRSRRLWSREKAGSKTAMGLWLGQVWRSKPKRSTDLAVISSSWTPHNSLQLLFDLNCQTTTHPPTLATMSSSISTATVTQPQRTAAGSKTASQAKEQTASTNKDDFFWTYTEEPHATRRQAIIKAHPEVHTT
jgi:hypothetical protein